MAQEGDDTGSWRRTERRLGDSRDLFRPRTSDIPTDPGVYKWRDGNGRVIYVGKAKNLRSRLTSYFQPLNQLHPRTQNMVLTARSLEWTVVGTELEALTLEYTWIKEFDPRFNVVFKDDKTYPYLAISLGEAVPRVWITRNRKRRDSRYFGPYAKVWPLRQSLDGLLKAFPVRTCTKSVFHRAQMTDRPCLLASIGKCSAPCVGRIGVKEHRRMAEQLIGILTGRIGRNFISGLTVQMKQASDDMEFEKAARLRDQISMLKTVGEQNAVVFDSDVDADVFGLDSDELEASVHAFFVRAGSIRGERNWSVERVEDIDDASLMSDLIVQVYSDVMKQANDERTQVRRIEDRFGPDMHVGTDVSELGDWGLQAARNGLDDEAVGHDEGRSQDRQVSIEERRDAIAHTQSMTATDAVSRAQATRARRERQAQTGRNDFLDPISPVPREVLVPIEPDRREELETWLTDLRGAAVTIRIPGRGEKRALMERADENAKQALARSKMSRIRDIGSRTQAMNDVAEALGLKQAPLRIEGYDISNTIGGIFQVASMVVFEDGVAKKSEYRRFAIRGKDGNGALDDLSAVYETITRRFRHGNIAGDTGDSIDNEKRIQRAEKLAGAAGRPEEKPTQFDAALPGASVRISDATASVAGTSGAVTTDAVPDATHPNSQSGAIVQQDTNLRHFAYKPNLIVVDGGKPQVQAVMRALQDCGVDDVAVCGLAKRLEEVWVPDDDYPIILKRQSEGMYLLQRVRDESHRFAITYHRQSRRKGALRSELDAIPGIGSAFQKRLLAKFGSVKSMRKASIEELQQVKGVGKTKAEAIYRGLHAQAGSGD